MSLPRLLRARSKRSFQAAQFPQMSTESRAILLLFSGIDQTKDITNQFPLIKIFQIRHSLRNGQRRKATIDPLTI
jgi:hypothetical protein